MTVTLNKFRADAAQALCSPQLQQALTGATDQFCANYLEAFRAGKLE